ncbi:MAG: hypothetical protein K9K67_06310 [Bacteriovoracaceae bacterium]|nr:hypothetical protein [Bacteriovoracaceae bacterium]
MIVGSIEALGGTVINALLISLLVVMTALMMITLWFYHNSNSRLAFLPLRAHGATNFKSTFAHSVLQRMSDEREYRSFKISVPSNDGQGFDHGGPNYI